MTDFGPFRGFFLRHPSSASGFDWRWRNFTFQELECRDGTGLLLVPGALDALQGFRDHLNRPIIVNSAYRSIGYNKSVGGAPNSYHLSGIAFDIAVAAIPPVELAKIASAFGFGGIGIYSTFIHVDVGPRRSWLG